ncbi:MAG: hypothetical protein KKE20_06870 [Nanoarchaeota archaeon]|nr:hypothetical protein [Nanoarchaeota archaeon]
MIAKLKELGLTEYEISTYLALLQHGPITGGKVSKLSKVPHGKVYWALHKLSEKDFVHIVGIKPQIFHANKPEIAINNLVKQKVDDLSGIKDEIIKEIKQIGRPLREEKIIEKIQVLSGKARFALNDYFIQNAVNEIRYIFTYEERSYSMHRQLVDAIKRGVKIRFITTLLNKDTLKLIKEDLKIGCEVRYLNVEEIRIHIMDDKEARIAVINPKDRKDRTNIYFEHTSMAKHMAAYFDELWRKAKPLK